MDVGVRVKRERKRNNNIGNNSRDASKNKGKKNVDRKIKGRNNMYINIMNVIAGRPSEES